MFLCGFLIENTTDTEKHPRYKKRPQEGEFLLRLNLFLYECNRTSKFKFWTLFIIFHIFEIVLKIDERTEVVLYDQSTSFIESDRGSI